MVDNYVKILKIMSPLVPHLTSECLSEINKNSINENQKYSWPKINQKYLKNKNYNIVIQVNGKKRALIESKDSFEESDLIEKIKKTKELLKFIENKQIVKTIFIKDKLINLIIK